VKYSGRNFLKVTNYPFGIFLITSRSLKLLIKGEPDFPPEATQFSAPAIL
jgi:hypothetical protein